MEEQTNDADLYQGHPAGEGSRCAVTLDKHLFLSKNFKINCIQVAGKATTTCASMAGEYHQIVVSFLTARELGIVD
jgi:hypothetical protein